MEDNEKTREPVTVTRAIREGWLGRISMGVKPLFSILTIFETKCHRGETGKRVRLSIGSWLGCGFKSRRWYHLLLTLKLPSSDL